MSLALDRWHASPAAPVNGQSAPIGGSAPSVLRPSRTDMPRPLDINAARDHAYAALDAIAAIAWPKDGSQMSQVHQPFARVYYQTTRHWLHYLDRHAEAWLGYRVIDHFFDLYVLNVMASEDHRPAPHWRPYLALASAYEQVQSTHLIWPLLWAGFWAHTQWDLADSIVLTHRDHDARHGRPPCGSAFRAMMLDSRTDELFYRAALDYLAAERLHRSDALAPHPDTATQWASRLRGVWVPTVQRWRGRAWRAARNLLDDEQDAAN